MKLIGSLVWGGIFGVAAVLLHSAFLPFGLILSLLGSGIGIWLVGRTWGLRRYKVLASFAWILVAWRAIAWGVGGERLVQLDTTGVVFIFVGWIVLLLVVSLNT